jgi:hypothetical protein
MPSGEKVSTTKIATANRTATSGSKGDVVSPATGVPLFIATSVLALSRRSILKNGMGVGADRSPSRTNF